MCKNNVNRMKRGKKGKYVKKREIQLKYKNEVG
jgi:hypothetical protein